MRVASLSTKMRLEEYSTFVHEAWLSNKSEPRIRLGFPTSRDEHSHGDPYSILSRMNNVLIREARSNDVARILELYCEGEIGAAESFSVEEARAHLAGFRNYPSYRVFVAELSDEIVGTYELLIMDNLAKRGRKSAIVEDVAVAKQYQGRGIGRAMMQHAMDEARRSRCYKLTLSSNLRRTDAHAFYEALGFEKHGYSFRVELA
jgi:ribosomal protein S18 acetylase RimI-like enzyme